MNGAVGTFEDRVALAELFNRYAEALDRKQWSLLEDVFTEDVATVWPGGYSVDGRDSVIEFISGFLGDARIHTHHMVGNFRATVDGNMAETSVYSRAVHQRGEEHPVLDETLGIFAGTARRGPAGWRFERFSQEMLLKHRTGDVFESNHGD
jgi:hypothetical protein